MNDNASDKTVDSLPPQLAEYARQFDAILERFEALISGLDANAFNWSPDDKTWSVGQIIEHLCMVDRGYLRGVERAIEKALAEGVAGDGREVRFRLFERIFISTTEPPPRFKVPAPKVVVPPSELDMAACCDLYRETQSQLRDLVRQAGPVHLGKARLKSPISSLLKLGVGATFGLLAAHNRRHLWQAENLMKRSGFPASSESPATESQLTERSLTEKTPGVY